MKALVWEDTWSLAKFLKEISRFRHSWRSERELFTAKRADNNLYRGWLNLEISEIDSVKLASLKDYLVQVPNIQLVATGGFSDREAVKTVYIIEIRQPLPLVKILREMPAVKSAVKRKRHIMVALK